MEYKKKGNIIPDFPIIEKKLDMIVAELKFDSNEKQEIYRAALKIIELPDDFIQQKFKFLDSNQLMMVSLLTMYVRFVHKILPVLLKIHYENKTYLYPHQFDYWFIGYTEFILKTERGMSSFARGEISNNIDAFFPYLSKFFGYIFEKKDKEKIIEERDIALGVIKDFPNYKALGNHLKLTIMSNWQNENIDTFSRYGIRKKLALYALTHTTIRGKKPIFEKVINGLNNSDPR
jgi:hypothetical protein